jgi:hypothetical protein
MEDQVPVIDRNDKSKTGVLSNKDAALLIKKNVKTGRLVDIFRKPVVRKTGFVELNPCSRTPHEPLEIVPALRRSDERVSVKGRKKQGGFLVKRKNAL